MFSEDDKLLIIDEANDILGDIAYSLILGNFKSAKVSMETLQTYPKWLWENIPEVYLYKCQIEFEFFGDVPDKKLKALTNSCNFKTLYSLASADTEKYAYYVNWCNKFLGLPLIPQKPKFNLKDEPFAQPKPLSAEEQEKKEQQKKFEEEIQTDSTEDELYTFKTNENGERYVLFGSYPQFAVEDEYIISSLNYVAGKLPTDENSANWTSFKYHVRYDNTQDFWWYKDVKAWGRKFRGVYFTHNRPRDVGWGFADIPPVLEMETNKIYWYEYSPIVWNVLYQNEDYVKLESKYVLDCQPFNVPNVDDNGKISYFSAPNDYENSFIQNFLKEDFYCTAFTQGQRQSILSANLNLSLVRGDKDKDTNFKQNSRQLKGQKIFLLSYQEAVMGEGSDVKTFIPSINKKGSDYAMLQGFANPWEWWLRNAFYETRDSAHTIALGLTDIGSVVTDARGVCPSLFLELKKS